MGIWEDVSAAPWNSRGSAVVTDGGETIAVSEDCTTSSLVTASCSKEVAVVLESTEVPLVEVMVVEEVDDEAGAVPLELT